MAAPTSPLGQNDASITVESDGAGSIAPANKNVTDPNTGEVVSTEGVNAADSAANTLKTDAGNVNAAIVNATHQETPVVTAYDANDNFASLANSSQAGGYDPSLNGNNISGAGDGAASISENGIASADGIGNAALHQPLDVSGLSAEEERLWSIVTTNSLDFDAWTALIDETERMSEGNISKIRKVYDTFLAEFPLCYGYWKKYADHEARLSSVDKVAEVYERAVQGVTYSVDMWLHYCVFTISTYGDPDAIRRLFERALAYVGTDYLCFPLWDKYIEYEISQQDWPKVATIYTRVLEIPNQQLDRYFEGFKELVASRPLSELRTAEEAAAVAVANSEENEGEVPPNAVEQSSKVVSASLRDAEELEKYIAIREELYKKAKDFDSKIIGFESAIRRPYFHVRPLNVAELENWHNYLDFIEGGDDFNKAFCMAKKEPLIITSKDEMREWSRSVRARGKSIGLVPTMGYLHEGHLSLIQESKKHTEVTVVSIYVNPGQFSPNEDLSTYPSDFLGDIQKLNNIVGGVDVVFHPQNLYDYGVTSSDNKVKDNDQLEGRVVSCVENSGMGHETWIRVENLEKGLCGISRPVFFRGVATIVAKLFNIVEPDVAVFGKKDYQQWRIIQRMVRDLDFGIRVIGADLVRDDDGLAKSSRNVRLSPQEREKALSISKSLCNAKAEAEKKGQVDCRVLKDSVIQAIHGAGGKVDYAEIVEQESLEAIKEIKRGAVFCVAAWFGDVRLIDNMEINVST